MPVKHPSNNTKYLNIKKREKFKITALNNESVWLGAMKCTPHDCNRSLCGRHHMQGILTWYGQTAQGSVLRGYWQVTEQMIN